MPRRKDHPPDVKGNMWNQTTPAPTVAVKAAVAVAVEAPAAVPRKRRGPLPGHGGAPQKEFTPVEIKTIFELARVGCTRREIAGVLGISVDTLERHLRKTSAARNMSAAGNAYAEGRATLRLAIRKAQIRVALDDTDPGQAKMLVFLGRVLLGQCPYSPPKASITTVEDAVAVFKRVLPDFDVAVLLQKL